MHTSNLVAFPSDQHGKQFAASANDNGVDFEDVAVVGDRQSTIEVRGKCAETTRAGSLGLCEPFLPAKKHQNAAAAKR